MESLHQIQIFSNQGANKSEDYRPHEVQDSIFSTKFTWDYLTYKAVKLETLIVQWKINWQKNTKLNGWAFQKPTYHLTNVLDLLGNLMV